jgi:chromosome segregation protein
MYLKRVEICGFKSFADRTKLEFESGITAIVGPNGCGKSNISDSIRWCLGEQSARSMRSSQMMDIIFAGSQSRATTGMAEVSLTFDNSTNSLPIDFSDVVVTRRLFRSGESEYLINKAQCRLKDVRDLFLDTGIGSSGYSIIEQGKVEFILGAKPEERRELFEEAAGISKYKARREETLRKLEKVEIDTNRVNDMLGLLKEQINALDLAARKAKQFQKHQQDLKRLEIASLVHGINDSLKEIQTIDAELIPNTEKFEEMNAGLAGIEAELAQLRFLQVEKDDNYIKISDEFSKLKAGINLADERISQSIQRETELKERQENLSKNSESSALKSAEYHLEIENLRKLRIELAATVEKLEREYLEQEALINGIRADVEAKTKELAGLRSELFEITQSRTGIHNETGSHISMLARCQSLVQSHEKDLRRLQEQLAPKQEELKLKQLEALEFTTRTLSITSTIESIKNDAFVKESEKSQTEANADALRERVVSIESSINTLVELDRKDPRRSSIYSVLSSGIPGLSGPLSGLIKIDGVDREAVVLTLGEKLDYIVADNQESATSAIEYMESNGLGPVTFIIADRVPQLSTVSPFTSPDPVGAKPLLSYIKCDPPIQNIINFLCGETYISANRVFGRAVITGGKYANGEKPFLIEQRLVELRQETVSLKNEFASQQALLAGLVKELEEKLKDKASAETELARLNIHNDLMRKEEEAKNLEVSFIEKEVEMNAGDITALKDEETLHQQKLKTLEETLNALAVREAEVKTHIETLEAEVSGQRERETSIEPLLTEAKVAWGTQKNELMLREREEEKLAFTISSLESQAQNDKAESEAIYEKLIEQTNIQAIESANLKNFQQQHLEKEKDVKNSLIERQELMARIEVESAAISAKRHEVEALKQEIHEIELRKHSFQLQNQNSQKRLSEGFGLTFEESFNEYSAVAASEEEIVRLKRKLESMGAVNMAAPEEYANLEERYNFLLTQQQDLLKAREDLHQVILKINRNTLENFRNTFTQVRENFQRIYQQLFEGGQADLVLTDENNLLETGIDIVAQPPGKKLQNITLLSGGEKALTAIALLFAFFMVKASPFCILDEVDAPLDDANIGRYISMVKSFAAQTQFLVVTHNKRTMEMADILYGVTMEELGVSKIISVRLQREKVALPA